MIHDTGGTLSGMEIVRPADRVIGDAATELKQEMRAVLRRGKDVIVDLADVSFMDSAGLSALVTGLRQAKNDRRRLVLCSVPDNVYELLKLTRLHRRFEIQPDLPTARIILGSVR